MSKDFDEIEKHIKKNMLKVSNHFDNLEKDFDISFKTIYPSLGEGSEYPGTSPQLPV